VASNKALTPSRFTSAPNLSAPSVLSSYVVTDARIRLRTLALIYALGFFLGGFLIPKPAEWQTHPLMWVFNLTGIVMISVALALFVTLRSARVPDSFLVPLAFAFEILGAIGIEIGVLFWGYEDLQGHIGGVSWTGVWVITFSILFPATTLTTLGVAVVAASVRPVLLWVVIMRGAAVPDLAVALQFIAPTYICVIIAVIAARTLHSLGRQVQAAHQMGSYHLIHKLGEGGMGEVWTAEHRFLARRAAIKLVRDRGDRESSVQAKRFEREVQATAQLQSPNTIHVYDYGISDDGTFYYVMELLDGLDLQDLVRDHGPMPAPRVIHLLRQACHSLSEAHERGLVHRDVKPANMFVCRAGQDFDVLKVLDFGLVKGPGGKWDDDQMLTQAGSFYGTPAYASPEMARGERDAVDAKSDLYSLGCVAFWMLTGRTVFEAENAMGILVKHNTKMPEPTSRYSRSRVPEELDRLILQCLAKEKDDRPASAGVLMAAFDSLRVSYPWSQDAARQWWEDFGPATATSERMAQPGSGDQKERTVRKRWSRG
jgi:serine/threonine-protein kinase